MGDWVEVTEFDEQRVTPLFAMQFICEMFGYIKVMLKRRVVL